MQPHVKDHIIALSDEALVEYIKVGTTMYDPEAVEFAKQMLSGRGIGPQRLMEVEAVVEENRVAEAARKAEIGNRPLGPLGRTMAFLGGACGFVPFLFYYLVARFHLRSRGEHHKIREMWRSALMGLASVIALLIILPLCVRVFRVFCGSG